MVGQAQQSTYPSVVERYCALLAVSEAIVSNRDLDELFHDLAERLGSITSFDFISVLLHDAERDLMRLHLLETSGERILQPGWEAEVEGSAAGHVWQTQAPLIVHDIDQEERFPLTTDVLRRHGMKSLYVFPLTSAGRRLGVMGFGCQDVRGWGDESLEFIRQVVKQVAVALDNALNFESARSSGRKLARERDRSRLLLEVNNAIVSRLGLRELLQAISDCLRDIIHHDFAGLMLYDAEPKQLRAHVMPLVFDTVGGDTLERAFRTLKKGGFLVTTVEPPSEEKAKEFGVKATMVNAQPSAQQLAEINRLIDAGKLKTHVATVLPLAEVKKAHQHSVSGRTRGKIVLQVSA